MFSTPGAALWLLLNGFRTKRAARSRVTAVTETGRLAWRVSHQAEELLGQAITPDPFQVLLSHDGGDKALGEACYERYWTLFPKTVPQPRSLSVVSCSEAR